MEINFSNRIFLPRFARICDTYLKITHNMTILKGKLAKSRMPCLCKYDLGWRWEMSQTCDTMPAQGMPGTRIPDSPQPAAPALVRTLARTSPPLTIISTTKTINKENQLATKREIALHYRPFTESNNNSCYSTVAVNGLFGVHNVPVLSLFSYNSRDLFTGRYQSDQRALISRPNRFLLTRFS